MRLRLLLVPYDSGCRDWRMGAGPGFLVRHGLASRVRSLGYEVEAETIDANDVPTTEIATSFALWREVALRARGARAEGELPVILSGNCGATIGAVGAAPAGTAIVWLDAHGDFNTPETSASGFLDGMGLATVAGRCWRTLAASVPGFAPVSERHIVHVGARDLDRGEAALLERSEVAVVRAATVRERGVRDALAAPLDRIRDETPWAHLHVDLDVLDPERVGRANAYAAPDGLTTEELLAVASLVTERFRLASLTLSSYDPTCDDRGGIFEAAASLIESLVGEDR